MDKYTTDLQFDIEDDELPRRIAKAALGSGFYPYEQRFSDKKYADQLVELQKELVKLQSHLLKSGRRVIIVIEGRDAAGKGGVIKNYLEHLNPRYNQAVALPKPSDRELTQWYFQRYVDHFPAAGETVLFDRSWYNRAGVEPVMGFCTPDQCAHFLHEVPGFEKMIVGDGIEFFKIWLEIGREMQLKRFHQRHHNPLKTWKLSPVDLAALPKWDDYTRARDAMLVASDSPAAPWTIIRANDKRRARLNFIRTILLRLDYEGRDLSAIGDIDKRIALSATDFINTLAGG